MKTQALFFLLFIAASQTFSQENKIKQDFTNVYHYGNNITLNNFDGTRSSIQVNGNSATLFNSDGTQSTIDINRNSSILIASDGTSSSIYLNDYSSTIYNSEGTMIFVSHMQSTSSC